MSGRGNLPHQPHIAQGSVGQSHAGRERLRVAITAIFCAKTASYLTTVPSHCVKAGDLSKRENVRQDRGEVARRRASTFIPLNNSHQPQMFCLCGNSNPAQFRRSSEKHPKPPHEWWYVCLCCNLAASEELYTQRSRANAESDPGFVRTRHLKEKRDRQARTQATTGEFVTRDRMYEEAWTCKCGNTCVSQGFFPCDRDGNETEPLIGSDWDGLYVCAKCGRIICQGTLEVVGRNPSPKFLSR